MAQGRLQLLRDSLEKDVQNIEVGEASHPLFPAINKLLPANPGVGQRGLSNLLFLITSLDITDQLMLKNVQFGIINNCVNIESMQICVQQIHELALTDPVYGLRAAAALSTVSNLTVEGLKIRNVLITLLQIDYTQSETLRKENPPKFMNMVGFLGQVFSRVRLNDEPIRVLSVPHLVYQRRLLEGTDVELELSILLLAQNGHLLAQCQVTVSTLLSEFFMEIFSRLLQLDLDQNARGWLMLGHFLCHNDYKLTPEYIDLFKNVLGTKSMARIMCALNSGRSKLPIQILEEKSLVALREGPPEEGSGDK